MLRKTIDIFNGEHPNELELSNIRSAMNQIQGVLDVHHLHVWRLNEHNVLLESYIVIDQDNLPRMESIKSTLKQLLSSDFDIHHSTLEFEACDEPCPEPLPLYAGTYRTAPG